MTERGASGDRGTVMAEVRDTERAVGESSVSPAERRLHRARIVQIAVGCIWIVDAALQFQPRMFGQDLVNMMMLPNAHGQPAPVSWSITQMAHFVSPDAGVWNFLDSARPAVHRRGHALPQDGEAGHRRHDGLGLRRVVVRRGLRHAAHRRRVAADGRAGRRAALPAHRAARLAEGRPIGQRWRTWHRAFPRRPPRRDRSGASRR